MDILMKILFIKHTVYVILSIRLNSKASDIAIACSGSVTVELALGGLPTIVTYSASKLTEYVFRIFSWVKSVSIPNLLLQSEVIPELLFGKLNAKDLAEKAL